MAFGNFYHGKRIFLTGHTGFKGSWLAEWLLALGAEVHGYALDPQPHEVLYGQLGLASRLASDTRADLANRDALGKAIDYAKPDVLLHLAAQPLVRLSYEIPVETFATNVMGTIHVLDAVRRIGYPCQVVSITTDKCYENREWLHSYREEDAMGGHDPYSASKGCAELAIASYRNSFFEPQTGIDYETPIRVASARAGNVIGGGDWAIDRIIPDCFRAIRKGEAIPVRNKIATRPWQHVLEPISGYLWLGAALAHPERLGYPNSSPFRAAFNFGPALTSNRTVAQLVEELLRHMPEGSWTDQSDPKAPHEASKLNLAIDKAFHLLGWQPVWDFETTISRTAEWYVRDARDESAAALCQEQITAYTDAAKAKGIPWAR